MSRVASGGSAELAGVDPGDAAVGGAEFIHHDIAYLFDRFTDLMAARKTEKN